MPLKNGRESFYDSSAGDYKQLVDETRPLRDLKHLYQSRDESNQPDIH
jgi:hypothetical protein